MATVRAEAAPARPPSSRSLSRSRAARLVARARLRGLMMRPAVGMAVLILLVAGIGVGYALRGSGTTDTAPQLVRAEPLNDSVPVSATLERTGDSGHPARPRAPGDRLTTRSTRSGSSAPA